LMELSLWIGGSFLTILLSITKSHGNVQRIYHSAKSIIRQCFDRPLFLKSIDWWEVLKFVAHPDGLDNGAIAAYIG
ncbi:MAG: hypothetical protein ACYDBP_13390, partial [Leptospirales bacterium]